MQQSVKCISFILLVDRCVIAAHIDMEGLLVIMMVLHILSLMCFLAGSVLFVRAIGRFMHGPIQKDRIIKSTEGDIERGLLDP